jgi:hypothetical protein
VSVEVPVPPAFNARFVVLSEVLRPLVDDRLRDTVPWNPFTLARLIWEVPEDPARIFSDKGAVETLKSVTFTLTFAERVTVPLVADTVTV